MNPNSPANPSNQQDEIDLIELFQGLWAQKWLIAAFTAVAVAGAAAFAFLSTPTYEARSGVLPPRLSDIAGYNLGRSEAKLAEFKVEDVYGVFKRNLLSDGVKREFFIDVYLPSLSESESSRTRDELWIRFNESLMVRAPDIRNNPDFFIIKAQHEDPRTAAEWANLYVSMVASKTKADMEANLSAEIGTKALSIKKKIDVLRASAEKRRNDRIVRLREALIVAEAVGIDAPQVTAGKTSSDGDLAEFIDGNLMYMRGGKAIRAELEVLEAREHDDPFIPELPDLENQLAFLERVDMERNDISVFTLDSLAQVSEKPTKPDKMIIITLGFLFGGGVGFFVVFVRLMSFRRK